MYEPVDMITLKSGERVEVGVVKGPDPDWAERIEALLEHKGETWRWGNTMVLRERLDVEAHFYILHRGGIPFANMSTVETRGVGIFGHVFTKPEDRRKRAGEGIEAAGNHGRSGPGNVVIRQSMAAKLCRGRVLSSPFLVPLTRPVGHAVAPGSGSVPGLLRRGLRTERSGAFTGRIPPFRHVRTARRPGQSANGIRRRDGVGEVNMNRQAAAHGARLRAEAKGAIRCIAPFGLVGGVFAGLRDAPATRNLLGTHHAGIETILNHQVPVSA